MVPHELSYLVDGQAFRISNSLLTLKVKMYNLYYLPGTCSLAVHVALIEVGAEFSLHNVAVPDGEPRPPAYLAINPRGSVPTLTWGDSVLREGGAILMYLLDEHKSPLLPRSGAPRASALEWLAYANATLHPLYSRVFFQHKNLGDAAANNPLYGPSIEAIQKAWDGIEEQLGKTTYLCGEECTIADILVTVIANWTPNLRKPVVLGAKTKELFGRVIARPSYQKALAAEQVTYKVAA